MRHLEEQASLLGTWRDLRAADRLFHVWAEVTYSQTRELTTTKE